MRKSKNNTLNMTTGNPLKLIIKFAIPMLVGNIFQQLYNRADSIIVGRIIGKDALAAVGALVVVGAAVARRGTVEHLFRLGLRLRLRHTLDLDGRKGHILQDRLVREKIEMLKDHSHLLPKR